VVSLLDIKRLYFSVEHKIFFKNNTPAWKGLGTEEIIFNLTKFNLIRKNLKIKICHTFAMRECDFIFLYKLFLG
jgi:hypothetical protein